nr:MULTISPECIES: HYD1 signature containing ADP-ribosyltransferase family protein [Acinetobacter]
MWVDPYGLSPKGANRGKNSRNEEEACALPKMVEMYHYTNKAGYNAINSNTKKYHFKASKPNRIHPVGVYLTPLSIGDMRAKGAGGIKGSLGVTSDKVEYYFHFKVDECKLKTVKNSGRTHVTYSPSDLEIDSSDMISKGPTVIPTWNE